jgi:hypothetical protein
VAAVPDAAVSFGDFRLVLRHTERTHAHSVRVRNTLRRAGNICEVEVSLPHKLIIIEMIEYYWESRGISAKHLRNQ